ncbi:MAG: bacillithiol biosynthesis deacetylase BshB1 [Flavobacteriales bacterium]|nr:bacillithiol biosynthesis deacetylase BshB1 [Flavobacteriales bacterium]
MKLDILVIAAHPDDAELGAGGAIAKSVSQGKKVGVLDLTRGEMGTRGTVETRKKEAARSADILGLSARDNVGLPDGFIANTRDFQMEIIPYIRKYQPDVVLANAVSDRHPDHGKASGLVSDSCFLSGLKALQTSLGDDVQSHWRPHAVYHFIQDRYIKPDFIVDVSEFWNVKMEAIRAYETQFYTGKDDKGPVTPISSPDFIHALEARGREYGRLIHAKYGEGFTAERVVGIDGFSALI